MLLESGSSMFLPRVKVVISIRIFSDFRDLSFFSTQQVKQVFGPGHGGDKPRYNSTLADRFVYLLTDGMSNDRRRTVQVANNLKQDLGVTISAIGGL